MLPSVIWVDIVSRLSGVLRSWVNPRYLGAAEYGKLGVLSAILLFASFCDLGLTREFELTYPSATSREWALRSALWGYLPSAAAVTLVLECWIGHDFGANFVMATLPYFLSFGICEIWMVALRAGKQFKIINAAALLNALALNVGSFLIAPRFGALGLSWLMSSVTVMSLGVLLTSRYPLGLRAIQNSPLQVAVHGEAGALPVNYGRFWLFAGQLLPLLWLTLDRLFLAKRLSPAEMGYWSLGGLPGALLIGVANTAATLHMASWVRREREWTERTEIILFLAALAFGMMIYSGMVKSALRDYVPGLAWNQRLILTHAGLAAIFYYDGYRRTRIASPREARNWFALKAFATLLGILVAAFFGPIFFPHEPRAWVLSAFQIMLFTLWILEKKWGALTLQLALTGACLMGRIVMMKGSLWIKN